MIWIALLLLALAPMVPLVAMPATGAQLDVQTLYNAVLCVWELSFLRPAAEALAATGAPARSPARVGL